MEKTILSVQSLSKRYGEATVVDSLSFDIGPGECLGVIGPNGAGKTTTIRMCLGLTTPDGGSLSYFERPEGGESLQMPRDALAIKAQIGVVTQMDTLDPDFTCADFGWCSVAAPAAIRPPSAPLTSASKSFWLSATPPWGASA